ncbi:dynein axonemal assembly factor 1 [Chironomus tepperi]|uniref:dynein axonemal assembly factor 1 n=1 Tax=Chironomus tepperi TaxID=113505 RepID=UPI00391F7046
MSDREDRRMTKKAILDQCKRNKLYTTPRLNDVLYLHFQGYPKIENLDEYTGLKCLWLESNAISKIEGLSNQPNLKSLFLQNNLISKIENLENCRELDTLVLSHNYIKTLENCCSNVLPVLNTLNISHNQLRNIDGLEVLKKCEHLSILDLSFNKIDDMMVIKILSEMPSLHVLTMTGNPVLSNVTNYRKTMILECKSLTYLDSRPVFPRDRACAEAWKRGGFAAEKREHEQWNREERRKVRKSVNALLCMTRGETIMVDSSDDEKEENGNDENNNNEGTDNVVGRSEESVMDIYEGNQKELIDLYDQQQNELDLYYNNTNAAGDAKMIRPQFLNDPKKMIEEVIKDEKIKQKKDEMTKMLNISTDQDKLLNILQMGKGIDGNGFGAKKDTVKKMLIEEIKPDENQNDENMDSNIKEGSALIEELSPQNDESASKVDEVAAKSDEQSIDIADNAEDMSVDSAPSIQDVATAINKFTPKIEPIALKLNDEAPKIYEFAYKFDSKFDNVETDKSAPKIEEINPESDSKVEEICQQTVPKFEQFRPKLGQISLKIVNCSEEFVDYPIIVDEPEKAGPPKIIEISSTSEEISPKIEENSSNSEQVSPKIEEISSNSESIPPKPDEVTPKIEEPPKKTTKTNPLIKQTRIEEISVRDITINDSNEMESMLWFDEDVSQQNYDSIDYQLPQLSDCITETFAEDDTCQHSGDFTKVLELCNEQKTDAMQLCFINENDKLMQLYDEAVDRKLVNESDVRQLKEIEALCREEVEKDDSLEVLPNLDGILTVTRLDLQEQSSVDDDNDVEVLQFSHIEISEVHKNAENLIDGVIKSLEEINMPL